MPETKIKRYAEKKPLTAKLPATRTYKDQASIKPRPLSDKQKAFVEHMIAGETVFTAAKRADITPPNAYSYMKRPYILDLIAAGKRKFEEDNKMTRQKVMDGFLESIDMAKLAAEPASMISGWREIAKMCGYYEPTRVQVDLNVSGDALLQKMTTMSNSELLKIIQGGTKQLPSS